MQPEILDSYADGLDDRAGRVHAAANRVSAVNGGNINAFGVAVGQVLGIPTRIALGVLHEQIASTGRAFTDRAETVREAARRYRDTEQSHTDIFNTEKA